MPRPVALFLAILVLSIAFAAPASSQDVARGLATAQEMCARCHVITKGAAFKLKPPSFQSIAIYRTVEDIWSRIISPSPHSSMPDMQWQLSSEQVQDLVAYITSLDVPVTLPTQ
jgi:mono/diheme cytochrome c family protein